MKSVFLILCFVVVAVGQQSEETKRVCNERAVNIAETLERVNPLRIAIQQGQRGDCIRQIWMDKMQKFGVKQASFLVEYSWGNSRVKFKVKSVGYYRFYFSASDASEIKDKKLLREIKLSGLGQELNDVVIAQAKNSAFATYKKGQVKRDEIGANLLDDEALPAFWLIF
ncbi:MAG: hypothetical protein ABI878_06770 [Acidobacteriota bacterium]